MTSVQATGGPNPGDRRPEPTSRNIQKRFLLENLSSPTLNTITQTLLAIASGDHARRDCAFNNEVAAKINELRSHGNSSIRSNAESAMRRIISHGPPGSNLWFPGISEIK